MGRDESAPLYPTPEYHPHFRDPRVDPSARSEASPGSTRPIKIEDLIVNRRRKQRLVIDEGTPDELVFIGRAYGLNPETVIRSLPAERRDSQIIYTSLPKDAFFKIDGRDEHENGIHYFKGYVFRNNGIGVLPTLITKGVVIKSEVQRAAKGAA